jgi:glycosyltransferase involved in cell wall biosynthesis
MKIIFFSRIFPGKFKNEINENILSGLYASGIVLQEKIISGIEEILGEQLILCNVLPVGSYPKKYKKANVQFIKFSHTDNQKIMDYNVGFNNNSIIKQFLLPQSIKECVFRIFKENPDIELAIFYSADFSFSSIYAMLNSRGIKIVVIIPDLPKFNNVGKQSFVMVVYQRIIDVIFRKRLNYADGLVLLTRQTVNYLNWRKAFVIVEGIADENNTIRNKSVLLQKKYILYTGTTHACYGIKNVIEAFLNLNDDQYSFVICGSGDSDNYLNKIAKIHKNIIYMGVQTRETVVALQKNAVALINPRQNTGKFTKYSFPSKTMEYLSSGNPVIAYQLDGMPTEYLDYIIIPKNNSIEAMTETMKFVLNLDIEKRRLIGERGKKFVETEKNKIKQCEKIVEMIADIVKHDR